MSGGRPRAHLGRWRIVDSEVWDTEDLDLLGPAEIRFDADGLGSFQMLAIDGDIDYRVVKRDREDVLEFSWEGTDEHTQVSGRGVARINGGELHVQLWIHRGDSSTFVARRTSHTTP